jgi:hypothetical protein
VEAHPNNVWKLQHKITQETYFMRFGPPSTRFVRDGEPLLSVFTNHGRPRQVSVAYPAGAAAPIPPDTILWDTDARRPDWAYSQRAQFTELD